MIGTKDLEKTIRLAAELTQDKRTKIYLSGPVSTYNNDEYARQVFNNMQKKLASEAPKGKYVIVNPVEFNMGFEAINNMEWSDFMVCDLILLNACNWIYMLDGWEISEGANMEKAFASKKGMRVINRLFSFKHHA